MLSLFAGIGPAILSFVLKMGFGGIVDKTLSHMEAKANNQTERVRIRTQATIEHIRAGVANFHEEQETKRVAAREGTERQKAKMNFPVFWFIIVAALGPAIFTMWAIAIYNVFFWSNGVWPQGWAIAAFPPQTEVWVNMSINWLFDPVGLASTVGTATVAGLAAGGKK